MKKALAQAGMKMKDIPQLKCRDRAIPPREGLCFKFMLGNCDGGEGCNFCHIPGDQIPDDYVKKVSPHLTNLVRNGLEKLGGQKKLGGSKRKRVAGPNTVLLQE